MEKHYDHSKESDIYQKWEESGAFKPTGDGEPFTIIMPPPNANDPLHVGHAMFIALEDIFIRFNRMKGNSTLWLPGTDHAGIETQFVFEKKLAKEDKSRFDFDRETLFSLIEKYVRENSDVAVSQMKRLGASADWDRFTFTLDPKVVDFVYATFEKLHQDSLVYREEKLVNYCTKCGTGYSELEIDHIESESKLYYIQYGPFVLATTRPETKFADTAVCVHPADTRYQKYIGQEIEVEGLNGKFKLNVIADEYVDPEFGTGVVKITPYHDHNDFDVWRRHKDEIPEPKQVIGLDGKLTEVAGKYQGMRVKAAREAVVNDLKERGLLIKEVDHKNSVGVCYRCKTVIEPLPLPQFFVKVEPLVKEVVKTLDSSETKIHGTGREKILRNWLSSLKDWNISRQIVWGIRMPVWYSAEENPNIRVTFIDEKGTRKIGLLGDVLKEYKLDEIENGLQTLVAPKGASFVVSKTKPKDGYIQETDTFDTWFSSGQWPVVTLSVRSGDFEKFYPTSVMETGYDILPFWVMRMMLLSQYLTGKSPFKDVYLHGLVRDSQGRKMSKSIGNVINPVDMAEKYGADALRMALVMGSTAGQDKSVSEQTIKGMRNFSNKIWNATRFVLEFEGENSQVNSELEKELSEWTTGVEENLEKLKPGQASEIAYQAFWHGFCDKWIEEAKKGSVGKNQMRDTLEKLLTILHPFAPFVTEACWSQLSKNTPLISTSWPKRV
jgi:valyl-tRNA synthetase